MNGGSDNNAAFLLNPECCCTNNLLWIVVKDNAPDAGRLIEYNDGNGQPVFFGTIRESLQKEDASIILDGFRCMGTPQSNHLPHNL